MTNHNQNQTTRSRHLKLCRMGHSLYLTIPAQFVQEYDLSAHDECLCEPKARGIWIEFTSPGTAPIQEPA
jgi:hypothetical protein